MVATPVVRAAAPHEGVKAAPATTCKAGAPAGTPAGKMWLKAKFVNGMDALLVMVNVKVALAGLLAATVRGLGTKAMVKLGAGTVTVRLIAAAVALGAWLLLRVTAGLVRDPAVVAVT